MMPTHHEIKIHLVNGNVRVDKSKILRTGDTVRYSSHDGKARVFFPAGSPYRVARISDTHKHTVTKPRKEKFEYPVLRHSPWQEDGNRLGSRESQGGRRARSHPRVAPSRVSELRCRQSWSTTWSNEL